ncbi:hypothetical protein [Olsenella profusa]|uniref:YggT family protein n=1 Tax=Olsenella profusa TaxID=138595 RepID=A0ABS2EZY9_9ACTN|nr:hypothetical protein [Olsenella profusa]MBM6774137.1 hypothetical protein [Olsenella profusa]
MRSVVAGALRVLALVCRVCAWALAALVVADALLPAGPRALLLGVNGAVTQLVPAALRGLLVFATPLGGAFRGDFAVLAIVLLVADWLLCRIAASLR